MTSKERMLTAMMNKQPDMVPVAPDLSNMIPCKLTGKPFWDIYLFQDPPLWKAYIDAVKYFGFDGWLAGVPVEFDYQVEERLAGHEWREAIVARTPERIYTRLHARVNGEEQWTPWCNVYYVADPPTHGVALSKVGLPSEPPESWEDVERRSNYRGTEAFHAAMNEMGDLGVIGVATTLPGLGLQPESVYQYYDDPSAVFERCEKEHHAIVRYVREVLKLMPDFLLFGISGFMITNPAPIFRQLSLPTLQDVTRLCKDAGIPSQIHCCGPEYELVKIAAEESDLSSINPLEPPPMGDCDLARVKREFGNTVSLMGNLHTTEVMLMGTPKKVAEESKKAIDAAAEGGGFILSTGDQCGRDTPEENIFTMIETARAYGKY